MDDLDQFLRPQIDQLKEVYRLGFEAGRRSAFRESHADLERIQEQLGKPLKVSESPEFLNKNEGAEPSSKTAGD